MESDPCQHYVVCEWSDGSVVHTIYDGREIVQRFWGLLTDEQRTHFFTYREFNVGR